MLTQTLFRFLIDRTKRKTNGKNDNDKSKKVIVKEEPDAYVWSIFTLEGVSYFTSKEILEEEANNMILEDKNTFFVETVHVDCKAADDAHKMLKKKFEKMDKGTLTAFMTNNINISKVYIQKIIDKSNGNAFLNLNTDSMTDTLRGPFCVLFTPKRYIFFTNAVALKTTFRNCFKQLLNANLRMVILPDMKHIER